MDNTPLMSHKTSRQQLKNFEIKLKKAIQYFQKNQNIDQSYNLISQVIQVLLRELNSFDVNISKQIVFLVGSTGAGKSTLLNYLVFGDDNMKIKNQQNQITTKTHSIALIGGSQATTLFPNIYSGEIGTFLDCAGEGDTDGIVIQILNSLIKAKIANNVEEAKIIFVAPFNSLKAQAGYGKSFKEALDKNSEFLRDISVFNNSFGLVITGAPIKVSAFQSSKQAIQKILTHSNVGSYGETVKFLLQNQSIAVFSRPSDQQVVGSTYKPPEWNLHQREKILEMINKISYTRIPKKDFFNTSSSFQVRESMNKALQIIEAKAANMILIQLNAALPLRIYTAQIQSLLDYLMELSICSECSFIAVISLLKWNNYLKMQFDNQFIKSIDNQLNFLYQFTNNSVFQKKHHKKNWIKMDQLFKIIKSLINELDEIKFESGFNFNKYLNKKHIKTVSTSENGLLIKTCFINIFQQQQKLQKIISQGKQQQSSYYKDKQIKKVSDTELQEYHQEQNFIEHKPTQEWVHQVNQHYQQKTPKKKFILKKIFRQEEYKKAIIIKLKNTRRNERNKFYDFSDYRIVQISSPPTKRKSMQEGITQDIIYRQKENKTQDVKIKSWQSLFKNSIIRDPQISQKYFSIENPNNTFMNYIISPKQVASHYWKGIKISTILTQQQQQYCNNIRKDYENVQFIEEIDGYQIQQKTRIKTPGHYVTKYVPQVMTKTVTKKRAKLIDITVRQLDQQKFNNDFTECNNQIERLKSSIISGIQSYQKNNDRQRVHDKSKLIFQSKYEQKYKNLIQMWRDAQYNAYYAINPQNNLQNLKIDEVMKLSIHYLA